MPRVRSGCREHLRGIAGWVGSGLREPWTAWRGRGSQSSGAGAVPRRCAPIGVEGGARAWGQAPRRREDTWWATLLDFPPLPLAQPSGPRGLLLPLSTLSSPAVPCALGALPPQLAGVAAWRRQPALPGLLNNPHTCVGEDSAPGWAGRCEGRGREEQRSPRSQRPQAGSKALNTREPRGAATPGRAPPAAPGEPRVRAVEAISASLGCLAFREQE